MTPACPSALRTWVITAGFLCAGGSLAAGPSTQFEVGGAVVTPKTYALADLQALPAITQTATFLAGNSPQTHTYTGASLWGVLDTAGIVVNSNKNDVLSRYVLATGSDGYKVVFSLGELNPNFGNRPDLAAYSELINGAPTLLGSDGFARVTAPGDVKGGRYVSNLVDLDVRSSGSTQAGTGGGPSSQFVVTGDVGTAMTFNLVALQGLPTITEKVGAVTFTGVSFWDLLNSTVGINQDPAVKNDVLGKYVVATGSDGYKALFSLGELDPDFGNQPDLIAYSADGSSLGADGFARIVAPGDVRAGRWVSNLVSLEVFSAAAVPEPETYALLIAGLVALGLAAKHRRARG
jgi:PEP-CTERM motif